MFPRLDDPISSIEKIKLYNNVAEFRGIQGRLLAEFRIFPYPRIEWDFEVLGGNKSLFGREKSVSEIQGHGFSILEALPYSFGTDHGSLQSISGVSHSAYFEELSTVAHRFHFYFPNMRFLSLISNIREDQSIDSVLESRGQVYEFMLDDVWSIRIYTDQESLKWLEHRNNNIGCRLTTGITFYQHNYESGDMKSLEGLQSFRIGDMLEYPKYFSYLFSFANAGDVGPLFAEGDVFSIDSPHYIVPSCAVASTLITTPLEQTGISWISSKSNLITYLRCLPTLERMFISSYWVEAFEYTLIWYQKATLRSPWPVIANSIGAALERLAYTILVEDESDTLKKNKNQLLFEFPNTNPGRKAWNLGKTPGQDPYTPTEKRTRLVTAQEEKSGISTSPRNTLTKPSQTLNPCLPNVEM
jgi:hypothetical protein